MKIFPSRGVVFGVLMAVAMASPAAAQQAGAKAAPTAAASATGTTGATTATGTTAAPSATGAPTATGAPAAPATGTAVPASTSTPADGGAYTVRLRSLERNVNELKEQVFMTKRRLNLLKETVLGGTIGASRAVIKHKSEMGSSFRLIKATYAMDGVQILNKADDSGHLADMPEFDVYNGAIQPGNHTLTVGLVYQGSGFGVFSYLKSYKFNVKSSHTFVAGEGKATVVTVVGYEKGGLTTNMEDKPAVEFRVNLVAPEGAPKTASAPASTETKK
ncbi:MAG: hypothetical protein SF187_26685 [Deltaproteobacteria bacterium]|nr:hypothetical protein [Deltaproteobacteria bacterium]